MHIFYILICRVGKAWSIHVTRLDRKQKWEIIFQLKRIFPCKCIMKAASDCASLSQILLMQCSRPGSAGPLGLCPDCGAPWSKMGSRGVMGCRDRQCVIIGLILGGVRQQQDPTGSIIFLCSSFRLQEDSGLYKIMVYSSTTGLGALGHYFSSSVALFVF